MLLQLVTSLFLKCNLFKDITIPKSIKEIGYFHFPTDCKVNKIFLKKNNQSGYWHFSSLRMLFNKRSWSLTLKDSEPSYLPVANGCTCVITNICCSDTNAEKVVLEGIIQTIRIDRLEAEDDIAQTEIHSTVLASIFPKREPSMNVVIPFSQLNIPTVRASGGSITLSGIYFANSDVNELDE